MKPIRIGRTVFQRLCAQHRKTVPIVSDSIDYSSFAFEDILRQRCFGKKSKFRCYEQMHLIAKQLCSFGPDQLCEYNLGILRAIASGVVLFIPNLLRVDLDLMGLFERPPFLSQYYFSLRPFKPSTKLRANSLEIFPSTKTCGSWQQHHDFCPVFVRWQIRGENNGNLMGITNFRWQEMSAWLDKWLPKKFIRVSKIKSETHLKRVRSASSRAETRFIINPDNLAFPNFVNNFLINIPTFCRMLECLSMLQPFPF